MNDSPEHPSPVDSPVASENAAPRAARRSALPWVLVLVLTVALAGAGWALVQTLREGQRGEAEWSAAVDALRAEMAALDRELDGSRERQRQIESRMGDNAAAIRVVREEVLGMAERATRVEEAITALSQTRRDAALSLRLDDLELLLHQAELRARLLADQAAAARALDHAAELLQRIDDPAYAVLRVSLEQERQALAELAPDPRPALRQQVAGLIDILPALAWQHSAEAPAADSPALLRLLDRLVQVRRISDSQMALTPLERASRRTSIELTLALALAALETGDEAAWRQQLKRARDDIQSLFDARSAPVAAALAILDEAMRQPLRPDPASLGSTLRELRAMRGTRAAALPPARAAEDAAAVDEVERQ